MNRVAMSAPVLSPNGFLLVLVDEAGCCGSAQMPERWRTASLDELGAQMKVDAESFEWAKDPKRYTNMGDDVMLLHIRTGRVATEEVRRALGRARKAAKGESDFSEAELVDRRDLFPYEGTRWGQRVKTTATLPTPAPLDDTRIVNTCACCGTSYTAATWEQLPRTGAKDVRDGGVIIHEDYRQCGCGSTRMVFTERAVTSEAHKRTA